MNDKMDSEFDDIRPYNDDELAAAMVQLQGEPKFVVLAKKYFPLVPVEQFDVLGGQLKTLTNFQRVMVAPILEGLVKNLSDGLTVSGLDSCGDEPAVLMTNHRDIVIDPAFLNLSLIRNNRSTFEIAIGDNLLAEEWIRMFVRINKSFIVKRGLKPREMGHAFMQLSGYIRHAINDKKSSVWIAQREGRAKDSNDRTQESLIKMFALSGTGSFIDNLKSLNISPVSISYEYDPCDYLKAKEFQQKRDNAEYKKTKQEDLLSMQVGIMGYKGRVHHTFTPSINPQLDEIAASGLNKKEQAAAVCHLCDSRIFAAYVIYPINRWAYEQLTGDRQFAEVDTAAQRNQVESYLHAQLAKIELPNADHDFLWHKLLEMYANPLINQLNNK